MNFRKLKIAIVCDWLTNSGGAEKIILALHNIFPNAPIYTSIYNPEKIPELRDAIIHTSHIQNLPWAKEKHYLYLGMMPQAFEEFNLDGYDIVISSSHSCAKGIITRPKTMHVCYCHSPMRYAWEDSHNYIQEYKMNGGIKKIAPFLLHKIRMWDFLSASRVDYFIANSKHVQNRIQKYYRRSSTVIYPFVKIKNFKPEPVRASFYLAVGRLTPYKRFDLIIETFNQIKKPLKIIGTGIASKQLMQHANNNIEFLGYVSQNRLAELYGIAKGLIFPQAEDFGITTLEAMASGCPVIAYKKGGALETIVDKKTGIFFDEQNAVSLKAAIEKFEQIDWDFETIRAHSEKFDYSVFKKELLEFIEKKWEKWNKVMFAKS